MIKIGLIGAGNMGSALIGGMLAKKAAAAGDVYAYDVDAARLEAFAAANAVNKAGSNDELADAADVLILAVKPDIAPDVLRQISHCLTADKLLISIVLGLSLDKMASHGGNRARYIRCMPNTPALVNEGMTCVSAGGSATAGDRELARTLFASVGMVEFLPEKDLEKVTALTGSSPAYIFVLIEAMADAAVLSGLPRALAYRMASQAVLGSAKMALVTGRHPGELKDMVCSPSGSTIEAIRALEAKGFRSAVIEAMRACDLRAREIAGK